MPSTMQALLEGRACGDIAHFLCLLPLSPLSHSRTLHAWILSLAFCWNLAAISISSVGVYSLIMNVSWTGGCPASWGCCCCVFAFLVWGVRQQGVLRPFHGQSPQHPPLCSPHFSRDSTSWCYNQALSLVLQNSTLRSPANYPALLPCLPVLTRAE